MIDDELRSLLSVNPSPGLEARIRARVDPSSHRETASSVGAAGVDVPSPAGWRGPVAGALAIAATLTLALGIGLLPRIARRAEPPRTVPVLAQQRMMGVAPLSAPVGAHSHLAAQSPAAAPSPNLPAPHLPAPNLATPKSLPQVQIDRAETLTLHRLFASPVSGAIVDAAPQAAGELVIPHIAIEPLTLDIRSEGAFQ